MDVKLTHQCTTCMVKNSGLKPYCVGATIECLPTKHQAVEIKIFQIVWQSKTTMKLVDN